MKTIQCPYHITVDNVFTYRKKTELELRSAPVFFPPFFYHFLILHLIGVLMIHFKEFRLMKETFTSYLILVCLNSWLDE